MPTPKKNKKNEVRPAGQTPEGIRRVNNPADGKAIIYQKPTIAPINKPLSTKKVNSTACALCDGYCQTCDVCDGYCVTCDVCEGCDGCDICVGCDTCDACDGCDGCDLCVGCDTCDAGCDVCVVCDLCDAGCDICVGCDTCDAGCDICVGCDTCDAGCDVCVGCDTCDAGCDVCVGCETCDAVCETCDSCVDCETCVTEDTSLPVTLTTFGFTRKKDRILLSWRTESEVNNLGFFLFKAPEKEGPFAPVNTQIIPGAGSTSEAHDYTYTDPNVDNVTTYWYLLEDIDVNGETATRGPIECRPLSGNGRFSPDNFRLSTNYPNPFNAQTSLSITVPGHGRIEVDIVDVSGRTVRTLLNRTVESGTHRFTWDCKNDRGASVPSGTYFCRVRYDNGKPFTFTQKMSYIR
jgi:hypothetical protein